MMIQLFLLIFAIAIALIAASLVAKKARELFARRMKGLLLEVAVQATVVFSFLLVLLGSVVVVASTGAFGR